MKIAGSIGWLTMRGIMSRMNSRNAGVPMPKAGRTRNDVRKVPASRIPRWAAAPPTAPQAVATIPNRSAPSTVPTMIPLVYRIGARA